jgi:hypothetical protein
MFRESPVSTCLREIGPCWPLEFQAKIINGRIDLPQAVRERFSGKVHIILFPTGADHDRSMWPKQNRRRWELITKQTRRGLTDVETEELATLQQRADERLAQVGPPPVEQLKRLYAELSKQD